MSKVIINRELARKVLKVVDKGLTEGEGEPIPGQMCVEAAVNFAMGLPHGDEPPCVGVNVRAFKIELNDKSQWGSDKDRAKGLREVAIAQLGSNTINQKLFSKELSKELAKLLWDLGVKNNAPNSVQQRIISFLHDEFKRSYPSLSSRWESELVEYLDNNSLGSLTALVNPGNCDPEDVMNGYLDYDDSKEALEACADACRNVLIRMKSPGAKFLNLCHR